ncbi:MAG: serine/threonine-protein kinase [Vicinamibacterales bacterium]
MTVPKDLERIGRYQVLERVGKGGMGVLYRGFDPVLDREVAIKLMLTDFTEDHEQMRPRFYREARAAAKLNHRNIVTIFEFAEESNVPYIVMEFLRGTPLGARLAGPPPLSVDDKLNIVAQLCDGLGYAHEQGVVHRDVKPDNVFILEDGSIKLLDFGIAKLTTSNLTRQGDVLGSASYMSPEQVGGSDSVDGRADVFSTGVVLYEMLSGHKPFEADAPTAVILKILRDDPTPIETYVPGLPPRLVEVVKKSLAKNPDERFPTADALGRELQSIRKALPATISTAELDETRFASTQVMKALHEDFQKLRAGSAAVDHETMVAVGQAAELAREVSNPETEAGPAASGKGWIIPAAAVLLVAALGGGYFVMSRGSGDADAALTGAPSSATASSTPPDGSTAPVAAPPATPASATPPAATPPSSAEAPAAGTASAAASTAAAAGSPAAATAAPPAAPAVVPAAASSPPARPAVPLVAVSLSGAYPFQVLDGSRQISAANTSHQLKTAAGKTLTISAPEHFLRQSVRVEGTASSGFDWQAPGLGRLDVRSPQETCDVIIGDRRLGNPPLIVPEIAAGQYRVDISCAGDVVKTHYATVREGQTYVAAIR